MRSVIRPAIICFVLLTILTGVIYPVAVTAIAKVCFRDQADGSVITVGGREMGSSLIAQSFTDPKYFWPRPSAANYDATAGSGSNLAQTNPAQVDAVKARLAALHTADPQNSAAVPVDLITASASGLDPHISIEAARYQASRIAKARGLSEQAVQSLVEQSIETPTLDILGQPRVNVLRLNLALDQLK